MRPVVIYGGVADIAQERLLREVGDLYEAPPSSIDGQEDEVSKSGIVKVSLAHDTAAMLPVNLTH